MESASKYRSSLILVFFSLLPTSHHRRMSPPYKSKLLPLLPKVRNFLEISTNFLELERRGSLLEQVSAIKAKSKAIRKSESVKSMSEIMEDESEMEENSEAPSFSKYKVAFDNLLQDGDFSKNKKEEISKLPNSQKWEMLKQYKSSTLDMLVRKKSFWCGGRKKKWRQILHKKKCFWKKIFPCNTHLIHTTHSKISTISIFFPSTQQIHIF